ncbi:hypothetical protein TKK_0017853 [Trichogramma kaykai]
MTLKLDQVYSWLYVNILVLNLDKSVYIAFGKRRRSLLDRFDINMNGNALNRVNYVRYLGVTFNEWMKWNIHVEDISKRTKYLIYIFHRLKLSLSREQLVQIMHGQRQRGCMWNHRIGWRLFHVLETPTRD